MHQNLLLEIRQLTHEIRSECPHLSNLLKEIPTNGSQGLMPTEQQLREHLTGLRVWKENYRKR